ncbi:hypothetical protein [Nonomuraea dietziae]|uniref:hypothetical protein n=1 Tax=Nonomuraea dietziae TaxID=65515 RepID=UPI0031DF79A9
METFLGSLSRGGSCFLSRVGQLPVVPIEIARISPPTGSASPTCSRLPSGTPRAFRSAVMLSRTAAGSCPNSTSKWPSEVLTPMVW